MQTYNSNYSYNNGNLLTPVKGKKRHLKSKRLLIIVSLILLAFVAKNLLAAGNGTAPGARKAVASFKEEEKKAPEPPPKKVVDTTNLVAAIDQINAKYPTYNTSVAIVELNSDKLVQTGDTYPYVAASTTKLLTALYYLNRVEAGEASLTKNIGGKPAQEQLRLMINRSDNTAWHQVNTYLSKAGLMNFAKQQGLTSYDYSKNTMTSSDMARLMAKIYRHELINQANTTLLFSWMQKTSEERFIPPGVPATSQLYHKAGYLADRAHDVAIIENGTTPFVLVVYSKTYSGAYNFTTGQQIFKQVTTQALTTFNQ